MRSMLTRRISGAAAVAAIALSVILAAGCALLATAPGSTAPILLPLPSLPEVQWFGAESTEGFVVCLAPQDTEKMGVFLQQYKAFAEAYTRLQTPLGVPKPAKPPTAKPPGPTVFTPIGPAPAKTRI